MYLIIFHYKKGTELGVTNTQILSYKKINTRRDTMTISKIIGKDNNFDVVVISDYKLLRKQRIG